MQNSSSTRYFISYTRLDSEINKSILLEVEQVIRKYGKVYIDLIHNDNLIDPQKKVFEELEIANVLIVLYSENIFKSQWVNLEIKKAEERNIPILKFKISEILDNKFEL